MVYKIGSLKDHSWMFFLNVMSEIKKFPTYSDVHFFLFSSKTDIHWAYSVLMNIFASRKIKDAEKGV